MIHNPLYKNLLKNTYPMNLKNKKENSNIRKADNFSIMILP